MSEQAKAKRRGHGEGTIKQRADGRWEARVTLPEGGRKSLYGKTRKEVQDKLRVTLKDVDAGIDVQAAGQSVGAFLDRWLADVVAPTLAPKTVSSYTEITRRHIVPTLGRVPLGKLTPADVQRLLRAKEAEGLSPRTVAYVRAVLRVALNRALKWGMVSRNAAALADAPRAVRVERRPWDREQAVAFLKAAEGSRLMALFQTATESGMRLGEVLGLRWQDIDLDRGELRVRRVLQRVAAGHVRPEYEVAGGGEMGNSVLVLKEPKTAASRRTLHLSPNLIAVLRAHNDRQRFEERVSGSSWEATDLVFTNRDGGPMEGRNVLREFKRLLKAAGLPDQRFHDIRHCAASLMLAQGVPARVVMDQLGHTQISTTLDLYSHVMPTARRDLAEMMGALLTRDG
jgi:integrase